MKKFIGLAVVFCVVFSGDCQAQFALAQKISATGQVISQGYRDKVEDAKAIKAFDADLAYTYAWDAWADPMMTPKEYNQCIALEKMVKTNLAQMKKDIATSLSALDAAQGFLNEASTAFVAGDIPLAIKKHSDASKELFFHSKFRGFALMFGSKAQSHHAEWRKILSQYPVPNN